MLHNCLERAAAGAVALETIMRDDFTGSGNIDLRAPDTLQYLSNVWNDTEWVPANVGIVDGGYAKGVNKAFRYDVGNADVKVTAIVNSVGFSGSDDNAIGARCADVTDDGFPTDLVFMGVEHDNNLITLTERSAAATVQTISTAYNPPEGVDFEIVLIVDGSTAYAYAEGVLRLTMPGISDIASPNTVMFLRGTAPLNYLATVQSFKVEKL